MGRKKILLCFACLLVLILTACNGDLALEDRYRGLEDRYDTGQMREGQVNISSDFTTMSSDQLPHTKAILIHPAKYIYVEVEAGQRFQPGRPARPDVAAPQQPGVRQPQEPGAARPPEAAPPQEPEAAQPQQPKEQEQPAEGISAAERKVVELTNAERQKNGLPPLQIDQKLSNVAREKSNDMQANNYFSHSSPTYGSPFDMMRDKGVSFNAAAENIAMGQSTPEQVVQSWMNSAGHRQNILNGAFTHIGVGYNSNGHYWTQMFISK